MPASTSPASTRSSRLTRPNRPVWLGLGWIVGIGLVVLGRAAAPDGREHAPIGQFLGRFHPIVVHLPIGLILLVPVLDLLGRSEDRRFLAAASRWVLGLAIASALVAAADGWLLGWSGGYKGPLVIQHMWGGIIFAILCLVTGSTRPAGALGGARPPGALSTPESTVPRPDYPVLYQLSLTATLLTLAWAAHLGGSLSHGDNYLTEYLPGPLRRLLHIAPAQAPVPPPAASTSGAPTVYAKQIQPIFDHSCVSCHGPQKVKGKFRLDTYAELMKGGDSGPSIIPWQPAKSELVRRLHLPSDDDDFMPSNGKNVLSEAQKSLIEQWIAAGASDRQPLLDR